MEAVLSVVCIIVVVALVAFMIFIPVTLKVFLKEIRKVVTEIKEAVESVAESKKLSTILSVEGKKDFEVTPEDFKPKREELRENMLTAFEKSLELYKDKKGRITNPETVAYVVLDHSGFTQFVVTGVKQKVQNALARIIANQDISNAKRFITMLARNL